MVPASCTMTALCCGQGRAPHPLEDVEVPVHTAAIVVCLGTALGVDPAVIPLEMAKVGEWGWEGKRHTTQ